MAGSFAFSLDAQLEMRRALGEGILSPHLVMRELSERELELDDRVVLAINIAPPKNLGPISGYWQKKQGRSYVAVLTGLDCISHLAKLARDVIDKRRLAKLDDCHAASNEKTRTWRAGERCFDL